LEVTSGAFITFIYAMSNSDIYIDKGGCNYIAYVLTIVDNAIN